MNIINILHQRELNNITEQKIKNLQTFEPFIDRLELQTKLSGHDGCVNCLEFNTKGNILASASDDLTVCLWNPYQNKQITSFVTPHRGNIFSGKYCMNLSFHLLCLISFELLCSQIFAEDKRSSACDWSCRLLYLCI